MQDFYITILSHPEQYYTFEKYYGLYKSGHRAKNRTQTDATWISMSAVNCKSRYNSIHTHTPTYHNNNLFPGHSNVQRHINMVNFS